MELVGLKVSIEADVTELQSAFSTILSYTSQFESQISKVAKSGVFKDLSNVQQQLNNVTISQISAELDLLKVKNESISLARNEIKLEGEKIALASKQESVKRREKDAYSQLVAERNANVRSMFNEFAEMKKNGSTITDFITKHQQLIATYNQEQQELKDLESLFGRNQRNVGNYANSYNGLNNSIMQITREMPAFANSLQTGFMGISNNIGPLADAIKQARFENDRLKASGQATTPVWKQLAGAIFSWQTALSVSITLLTVYGAKIIDSAFGLKAKREATERAKKAQEEYNNILTQGVAKGGEEVAHLKNLQATMTNANNSMLVRKQAYNEAVKLYPTYLSKISEERALTGGLANTINNDLIPALFASARARAYQNKVEKMSGDVITLEDQKTEVAKRYGVELEKLKKKREAVFGGGVISASRNIEKENFELIKQQKLVEEIAGEYRGLSSQIKSTNSQIEKDITTSQSLLSKSGNVSGQGQYASDLAEQDKLNKKALKEQEKANKKAEVERKKAEKELKDSIYRTDALFRESFRKNLENVLESGMTSTNGVTAIPIEFEIKPVVKNAKFLTDVQDMLVQISKDFESMTEQAMVGVGEAIGSMIVGDSGFGKVLNSIGSVIADFLTKIGKMMIEAGIQMEAIKKAIQAFSATGVGGSIALVVAGIGAVALGSALKKRLTSSSNSRVAFADGGVVSGATNALIGEYAGARRNPEIVAPLDKLEGHLRNMNLGGSQVAIMDVTIKGSDIVLAQQREQRRTK